MPPAAQAKSYSALLTTSVKYSIVLIGCVVMVIPFLWMLSTSFKPDIETVQWPPRLIPAHPTISAYQAIAHLNFLRYFANTVLVSIVSTLFIVGTSVVAGYVFAKHTFPLRDFLFGVILVTAIFPFETYMLPMYDLTARLHWVNSYQGIIFPYVIMSFGIFLMRQTIGSSIPDDLLDMARIDGCSEWGILTRIVVPLSISAMSALAIFAFIQAWTLFIWPLLVVAAPNMYTMELALATLQRQFTLDYNVLMAGSVINVAPLILIFALLRRQILEGIALTGMKG